MIGFFIYFPLIYIAFNSAKDSFDSKIKLLSILTTFGAIPLCTATLSGRKYYKCFEKASKLEKEMTQN